MEIKLTGAVISVSRKAEYALSKEAINVIHLLEGLGVDVKNQFGNAWTLWLDELGRSGDWGLAIGIGCS